MGSLSKVRDEGSLFAYSRERYLGRHRFDINSIYGCFDGRKIKNSFHQLQSERASCVTMAPTPFNLFFPGFGFGLVSRSFLIPRHLPLCPTFILELFLLFLWPTRSFLRPDTLHTRSDPAWRRQI